jgi:serine/threonine-protein kinase
MADNPPGARSDDLVGRVLEGRYRVDARLGEGGLGVVYRATQTRLDRRVALKILHPEHARRPALRERFEREARSLGALNHPNIVDVIDFGIDGDAPYLVMELLEGRPLDAAIREGLDPERALGIGRAVVAAVAYAHSRGLVHRDLKPANVFLTRAIDGGEAPRVLDFGLAKFLDEAPEGGAVLTKTGAIMGTPAYMSPEQATGAKVDARADVYALGIVLFELVTGRRPFIGAPAELLRMHLLDELPTLASARPGLPFEADLEPILRRATAKSTSKRYADAGALLEALDAVLGARSSVASPAREPSKVPAQLRAEPVRSPSPAAGTEPTLLVASPARPRPRKGAPLAALAAAVVLFGISLALSSGGDPTPAPLVAPATTTPVETTVAEAPVEAEVDEPAAPAPLPPELAAVRARLHPGRPMARSLRSELWQYAQAHPHDARPWLIMAHSDFGYGGRSDALRFYTNALEADPSARDDADMMRDVVTMAGHGKVGREAAAMVESTWGRDAIPTIDAVLGEGTLSREEAQRLTRFRATLAAGGGS